MGAPSTVATNLIKDLGKAALTSRVASVVVGRDLMNFWVTVNTHLNPGKCSKATLRRSTSLSFNMVVNVIFALVFAKAMATSTDLGSVQADLNAVVDSNVIILILIKFFAKV